MTETGIKTQTDYLAGEFRYKNNELQFFPHSEGYVKYVIPESCPTCRVAPTFKYVFNYMDHLGNVRLSYSDTDGNGVLGMEHTVVCFTSPKSGVEICNDYFSSPILEENHYYPFGLKHQGYNMNNAQPDYQYKYNGKELQTELNLNVYDLGARLYDPVLARFMVMDPMADFVNYQSPFVASDNNPVLYRDEYGLGILNVIGNLFRRATNGVKRILSGKNCNCGGKEESIADSWKRPDFGWYESDKGSSRSYKVVREPFMGEIQYGFLLGVLSSIKPPTVDLTYLNNSFNDGDEYFTYTINRQVTFNQNSNVIKDDDARNEKFLEDIVKTLKEYPHMKLHISGNVKHKTPSKVNTGTDSWMNGQVVTLGELMVGRARAVEAYLIRKGISWKRLTVGTGMISEQPASTTLKFTNVPVKKHEDDE